MLDGVSLEDGHNRVVLRSGRHNTVIAKLPLVTGVAAPKARYGDASELKVRAQMG